MTGRGGALASAAYGGRRAGSASCSQPPDPVLELLTRGSADLVSIQIVRRKPAQRAEKGEAYALRHTINH